MLWRFSLFKKITSKPDLLSNFRLRIKLWREAWGGGIRVIVAIVGLGFMALGLGHSNWKDGGRTCLTSISYVWEIRTAFRPVVFNLKS